jgi:hypothetical protein
LQTGPGYALGLTFGHPILSAISLRRPVNRR